MAEHDRAAQRSGSDEADCGRRKRDRLAGWRVVRGGNTQGTEQRFDTQKHQSILANANTGCQNKLEFLCKVSLARCQLLNIHVFTCIYFVLFHSNVDNSLMSNIQKLFSEKIEIFSPVLPSKVSILTGIIKISLKVRLSE